MAKVSLSIEFDNKEWKPISIASETSDKNALNLSNRMYRVISPKKSDYKAEEKPET